MPTESSTKPINQAQQVGVLIEKVESLADAIENLTKKFDTLGEFQRIYYVEHQRVVGDVDRHEKILGDVKLSVSEIEKVSDEISKKVVHMEDVGKLKSVLYGNGQVGVVGKITLIEKWIENQVWFQRLIISAVVGEVITVGLLVYHAFGK